MIWLSIKNMMKLGSNNRFNITYAVAWGVQTIEQEILLECKQNKHSLETLFRWKSVFQFKTCQWRSTILIIWKLALENFEVKLEGKGRLKPDTWIRNQKTDIFMETSLQKMYVNLKTSINNWEIPKNSNINLCPCNCRCL